MNLVETAAVAVWNKVEPWANAKWVEVKPELMAWIKDQFHEWMPILIAAAGKAVIETGTKSAITVEDKVTDMIPGQVDDQILDPMFHNVMGWVDEVFSGLLPKP